MRQQQVLLGCPVLRPIPPADLAELDLPKSATISFPDGPDKITQFNIVLRPDEGMYRCGLSTRRQHRRA